MYSAQSRPGSIPWYNVYLILCDKFWEGHLISDMRISNLGEGAHLVEHTQYAST